MRLPTKITIALATISFSVALACSSDNNTEDVSDTKTNWLKACDEDLECGSQLSCMCGICTMTCESDNQCMSEGPDAVCNAAESCSAGLNYCVSASSEGSGGAENSSGGSTGAGGRSAGGSAAGGSDATTGGDSGLGGAGPSTGGADNSGGAASGGSPTGGGGGSSTECGCVDDALDWHLDGGLAAYLEEHTLSACNRFDYLASPIFTDPPSETCSRVLDSCEDVISPNEIQTAVDHVEVQAALAEAPILYGEDTRPMDGQIFVFEIGGSRVEVGEPCTECENPIPDGVADLVSRLKQLATEQLAEPPCDELNVR